ncbi:hypothetical protein [Actinophytocola sp.]|nr:hypothetical protein [Actinophytocola sp.]
MLGWHSHMWQGARGCDRGAVATLTRRAADGLDDVRAPYDTYV